MNTLLCFSLSSLIFKPKLGLELTCLLKIKHKAFEAIKSRWVYRDANLATDMLAKWSLHSSICSCFDMGFSPPPL